MSDKIASHAKSSRMNLLVNSLRTYRVDFFHCFTRLSIRSPQYRFPQLVDCSLLSVLLFSLTMNNCRPMNKNEVSKLHERLKL